MNTVEVNQEALFAEADAAVVGLDPLPENPEGIPGESAGPTPEAIAVYQQGAVMLVGAIADNFAPNWKVTSEEKANVGNALGQALALWFPDQVIPPKYMALVSLAMAMGGLVVSRRDPSTGQLIPFPARVGLPKGRMGDAVQVPARLNVRRVAALRGARCEAGAHRIHACERNTGRGFSGVGAARVGVRSCARCTRHRRGTFERHQSGQGACSVGEHLSYGPRVRVRYLCDHSAACRVGQDIARQCIGCSLRNHGHARRSKNDGAISRCVTRRS
jgi:hypothetical protein